MELDKVIALIQAVSDSALTGFILDEGNLHLELQKVPNSIRQITEENKGTSIVVSKTQTEEKQKIKEKQKIEEKPQREERETQNLLFAETKTPICSPLVGTFYCAPSEGEEPFVRVGDRVTKGQIVGIIEAMKLMNEIECEQDGVISAILVENGQMVEYGQKLFLIQ